MLQNLITNITITFNPNIERLKRTLTSILENNVQIIIVDNSSNNCENIKNLEVIFPNISVILLTENLGIAQAQNIGIKKSIKGGSKFIWLSDQDTIYPTDFIKNMFQCIEKSSLELKDKIAAYSPACLDTHKNQMQPFIRFNPFTQRFTPEKGQNFINQTIASGMIIPKESIEVVGYKNENLFIDWVDIEWCWRATHLHGMKIIGCGDTTIKHVLGDDHVHFLGRKITIRTPSRHYYIIRNAVALAIYSKSPPFIQRIEIITRALALALIYPLIAPQEKINHLKSIGVGLYHGITNKLGPK